MITLIISTLRPKAKMLVKMQSIFHQYDLYINRNLADSIIKYSSYYYY